MQESEKNQLLFFDTFAHENTEELNVDLVQFPRAVLVSEVRVVPLGTRVQVDVPGGVRLGATNPSSFKLELFVNNLSKPNAATFQTLGVLEYQKNVEIEFQTDGNIPTDGLILKGWYTALTLAVYGTLTNVEQEVISPPPPPPPQPRTHAQAVAMATETLPHLDFSRPPPIEFNQPLPEFSRPPPEFPHTPLPDFSQPPPVLPRASLPPCDFPPPVAAMQASDWDGVSPREQCTSLPTPQNREHMLLPPSSTSQQHMPPKQHTTVSKPPGGASDNFHDGSEQLKRGSGMAPRDIPLDHPHPIGAGDPQECPRDPRERDHWDSDSADEQRGETRKYDRRSRSVSRDRDYRQCHESRDGREAATDGANLQSPPATRKRPLSPLSNARSVSKSPDRPVTPASQSSRSQTKSQERVGDIEPGELSEDLTIGDMSDPLATDTDQQAAMEQMYTALSDGEIQEADGAGYSDISSDEDNLLSQFDDADIHERLREWDIDSDYPWSFAISSFNPCQCDFAPLETFIDPSLTEYEVEMHRMLHAEGVSAMPAEATQLLQIVDTCKTAPHDDRWVEALEGVPALLIPGLVYLQHVANNKEVLETLIEWTMEGLDLDAAIAQPETAYKVRHLKMGVRLSDALCSTSADINLQLMQKNIQQRLLDLYTSQYMSSSLKLHIVRALDSTIRFSDGLQWFFTQHPLQQTPSEHADLPVLCTIKREVMDGWSEVDKTKTARPTAYQRLVQVMMKKETVRTVAALTAVLQKAHIYEVLIRLVTTVQEISEYTLVSGASKHSSNDDGEIVAMEREPEVAIMPENVAEEDFDIIMSCLEEISKVIENADNLISQPKRSLPSEVVFCIRQHPHDPYPQLYHMFNACHLLECIFVILSSPATCTHAPTFVMVRQLMSQMLRQQSTLLYLSSQPDTTNGIVRVLVQNGDYSQEDGHEESVAQQLGLQLTYCLQTIQYIDQLREYHAKDKCQKGVDDAEVLGILHSLYSMTFTSQGRESVAFVFSLDDNLKVLLPFIEVTGDEERDSQLKKSLCHHYTVLLLVLTARHSEQVEWLSKFATKILAFLEPDAGSSGSGKMSEWMTELTDWLQPMRKASLSITAEHLDQLIQQLKLYNDDILELPKGLATVLRVMCHLAVPPTTHNKEDRVEELEYKYVMIEFFSADCLSVFINILQKLGDLMLPPWQQGIPQHGLRGLVISAIVRPILALVKTTLATVIEARGTEFKDLSVLPCLFNLHTVMCSVSPTGALTTDAQHIQNEIVDILMSFTQPALQPVESDDALSGSLWTLMVQEVLRYVLTAPYTFISAVTLLSELLPLPLPIQTRDPLSGEEVTVAVNSRKLWSVHLQPLTALLQDTVRQLAGTNCQPLQQLLKRLCCQLTDLAAPTALVIVRSLLDTLLESMDASIEGRLPIEPPLVKATTEEDTKPEDRLRKEEVKSSGQSARILKLLAFLCSYPAVKAAVLHLCQSAIVKSDEKYLDVLARLVRLLNVVGEEKERPSHIQEEAFSLAGYKNSFADDKMSHIHAQESIVSMFQSLCDVEVTLIGPETKMSFSEQLACSMPGAELLQQLCVGLVEHIEQRDHSYSSILPALRTLALLMDHNYGFYHVKCALEKVPTAFYKLFFQINSTFSKDSSDCIATLSSATECIQFLVSLPEPPDSVDAPSGIERTFTLSFAQVKEMLQWSDRQVTHPLDDLDKLLQLYAKEEETLKAVYDSVNTVVGILNSDEEQPAHDIVEPVLPPTESLVNQFNMRPTYVLTDGEEDDRLNAAYWLSTTMGDDSDQEPDGVTCDIDEMSHKYCIGFDLRAELEKGSLPSKAAIPKPRKKIRASRRSHDTINTSRMRGNSRGFVAPMRGRGFGRGGGNTNRSDIFRSRAPNTSRPPSMHVDDFVKMENEAPPGMNAPRRMPKEMNRGRGFDRGRGFTRGRFFSPPGNYGRRDGGIARGGYTMRGNGPRGGNTNARGNTHMGGGGAFNSQGGSPVKGGAGAPWIARPPRQNYGGYVRTNDNRPPSVERMDRRRDEPNRGMRFPRGGRGRGSPYWGGAKMKDSDDRFLQPVNTGFYGRRDRGRHQRAFTK